MLIVQLYSGQNISTGDFYYRIEQPAKWLSKQAPVKVFNIDLLNISDWSSITKVPFLILHHLSDPDLLPVIKRRHESGLATIYELADNFYASSKHLAEAKKIGPPAYHIIMAELIKLCNAVQTTTVALQSRFEHFNKKFMVFPNLIESDKRNRTARNQTTTFTIGWGGSVRHLVDLEKYADEIIDWIFRHPKARFALMGSAQVRRLFDKIPSQQFHYFKPGGLQDYLNFLDILDVGIAPLLASEFNRCRSDVKFLEYASRGVVPLCSRIGPYIDLAEEGKSILLFDNASELSQILDSLIVNPERVESIAFEARRWLEENRLADQYDWNERIASYSELLPRSMTVEQDLEMTLHRMADNKLGQALTNTVNNPSPRSELQIFADEYPNHYQVNYFYGWALSKEGDYPGATEYLKLALKQCPDSIRTAELLIRSQILNGEIDEAFQNLVDALKIAPGLSTLLVLKGDILQIQNRHHEAFELFELVKENSPSLTEARFGYIRSAIHLGRCDKAEMEILELLALLPESPDAWFFQALLSQQKHDVKKAKQCLIKVLQINPQHGQAMKLMKLVEGA